MSKRRKRERETDLRRRRPHRAEKRVYLVVCEGETEKRDFDTVKRHPDVRLHTVHVRKSKHPQSEVVVRGATQATRDEYTEVWAVFDTDGRDVSEQVSKATRAGVETAPSTPTFESWLILHLTDHRAALESGTRAERALKRLVPGWEKGRTHFEDFAHGLTHACERAARLVEGTDPSTGVHRPVHVILRD